MVISNNFNLLKMIESNFKKDLERKIDLYVNGKLDEQQVDELWAELIQDEYYLDYTKSVANLKAIIEDKRAKEAVAPVYRLRKYVNYGVAAAIAIIIGVVGVMNYPVSNVQFTVEPEQTLPLDIYRGPGDAPAINDNEIIKQAIELASEGEVEQAVTMLEDGLESAETPDLIAEMSLTLGSIQYNYGDYEASLISFKRVVDQEDIDVLILEKGYWYLGNTHFQLDQLAEAEAAFQNAYDLNGQYSRVAKSYIDALKSVR